VELGREWRFFYRQTEDFLTAAVFGRLTYLPSHTLWSILRHAAITVASFHPLPQDVGWLVTREFWPRWELDTPTQKTTRKEPDVFLEFERLHLLVEAERGDFLTQDAEQWAAELAAFLQQEESDHLAHEFGDRQIAATLIEQDHQLVRFYIPESARWWKVTTITSGLGQALTDALRAVARENPRLSGVIDVTDFNATTAGQRIVDDGRLTALVQVLNHPGQPRNRGLLLRRLPEPDCEESIDSGYNNRRQRGHGSVVLVQPGPPCCGEQQADDRPEFPGNDVPCLTFPGFT